jgi:hypothetical protein
MYGHKVDFYFIDSFIVRGRSKMNK